MLRKSTHDIALGLGCPGSWWDVVERPGKASEKMPPTEEDSVRVVQAGNSVTVADSVKIVVEGQKSPAKVNVSKTKTPSGKTSTILSDLKSII